MKLKVGMDYGEIGSIDWESFSDAALYDFVFHMEQHGRGRPAFGQAPVGGWGDGEEVATFERVLAAAKAKLNSSGYQASSGIPKEGSAGGVGGRE